MFGARYYDAKEIWHDSVYILKERKFSVCARMCVRACVCARESKKENRYAVCGLR